MRERGGWSHRREKAGSSVEAYHPAVVQRKGGGLKTKRAVGFPRAPPFLAVRIAVGPAEAAGQDPPGFLPQTRMEEKKHGRVDESVSEADVQRHLFKIKVLLIVSSRFDFGKLKPPDGK